MRADHFSIDVQVLIETFATQGVRCLLVGGEAVIYHGYPRLTGDVDFCYEQTADNTTRLFAALREFWSERVPGIESAHELMEPGVVVQFGRPPHRVDLISAIDGVVFEEAWPQRVDEHLDLADGRQVPLSVTAARHKDLDDVQHLEPLLLPR